MTRYFHKESLDFCESIISVLMPLSGLTQIYLPEVAPENDWSIGYLYYSFIL